MTIHPRRLTLLIVLGLAAAVILGWRPPHAVIIWAVATVAVSVIFAWFWNRSLDRQRRVVDVTGLSSEQIAEIEAHVRGLLPSPSPTYTPPAHGWTCFHCGETFKTPGTARLHFGETTAASEMPGHRPAPGP